MTDHPITPPQWRVQEWWEQADQYQDDPKTYFDYVATEAARWGADQELEACMDWLANARNHSLSWNEATNSANLCAARRPKPPSLKEQALDELHISFDRGYLKKEAADIIRRALEQLDD